MWSIYAGATILGRVTIGDGAEIGGNVWLTRDVPPTPASRRPACSTTSSRRGGDLGGPRTMSTIADTCPWPLAGLLVGAIAVGLQWVDNLPLGATGAASGACPGPIAAQIGLGRLSSLFTLAGLLLGISLADALAGAAPSTVATSPCAGEATEGLAEGPC